MELGPAPITTGPYTGRVAAIAPSTSNPDLYYVGGADGGVWRTDNGGATWTPLGDRLPVTAVGALALDPANDQILYVGTGEANYANHSRYGVGLAKTLDGGATWSIWGVETFGGRTFHRLRIDPADSSVLYAAIGHAGGFPAKVAGRNHPLVDGPLGLFYGVLGWGKVGDVMPIWKQLVDKLAMHLAIEDIVAAGDVVAVRYKETGTAQAPFFDKPATGRSYELVAMEWFVVKGGQIERRWGARDAASQAQQLGWHEPATKTDVDREAASSSSVHSATVGLGTPASRDA
jgi:hypothetical protein